MKETLLIGGASEEEALPTMLAMITKSMHEKVAEAAWNAAVKACAQAAKGFQATFVRMNRLPDTQNEAHVRVAGLPAKPGF